MTSVDLLLHEGPQAAGTIAQQRQPRRHRPHRGGRAQRPDPHIPEPSRHHLAAPHTSLALQPSSISPSPTAFLLESSSVENTSGGRGLSSRGRGGASRVRGRGRGAGTAIRAGKNGESHQERNAEPHSHGHREEDGGVSRSHVPSRRQLDGILTQEENNSSRQESILHADAPEFHPGQQHQPRAASVRGGKGNIHQSQGKVTRPRRQSLLKSTAADIATRTHEDIANGIYECPICTNEVAPKSKIWSCKTCWTVFHLSCIKKWSTNEGSAQIQQRGDDGNLPAPRQWRCPGCNLPTIDMPSTYTCWCAKENDPQPISGIPPHSCGQTCGKNRILPRKCPHPCELLCHAGPCPPCAHMGPIQSCFCGKQSTSRRCADTNYETGWSCEEICGDVLPCGEHTCQRPCHEGLCGACDIQVDSRCYCGKEQRPLACSERGDSKRSVRSSSSVAKTGRVEEWTGSFNCGSICQRKFDCGKHHCERICHPQEIALPHCPRSPNMVSHCPCGKTLLRDISSHARETCEDSIPNCTKQCAKKLRCGHICQQVCHSNECMPCFEIVSIACRCGRMQSSSLCHQGSEELPQCTRVCKATLNCGRHECGERCCPGEKKAAERQATKRKLRPLGATRSVDDGFEAEHICTRLCDRLLKCGNHTCPELCHKGPCGSCREAIFDEISCHCGKTVLQPPLPCGTKPPFCRYDCERGKDCGHPRVPHSCHGNEDTCPKCPFLEQKVCLCGKKILKNQPCWLTEARCGEVCGKKLKCGSHFCRKQCHRPRDCEDAGDPCHQACGKAKKTCGHPCDMECHAPTACREDKQCQYKVMITCKCQHLKQEMKCNASKTSDGNSQKSLQCDDECARLARNQKLALALNIDTEAHKDNHIPYANDTLKMYRDNTKWAQTQEREFRVFSADDAEKRLRFKPMPAHQRAFIHALAEDFGFDSESMDPEPHRHVAVFKTPRFVMAPTKTLAECVRIRISAEMASTKTETPKKSLASNNAYNGFLLTSPRFGLTLEELRSDFAASLDSTSGLAYDISFLPSEEIVIKARTASVSTVIQASAIEATLRALKPNLSTTSSAKRLANSVQLCALDTSLNIIRRESDDSMNNDGWSQVAAKAAAPRTAPKQSAVGEKSVYTVLGSRLREVKHKKEGLQRAKVSDVVDDWEDEMRREEAEEEKAKASAMSKAYASVEEVTQSPDENTISDINGSKHAESTDAADSLENAKHHNITTSDVSRVTDSSIPSPDVT